jgi:hypothetical protein
MFLVTFPLLRLNILRLLTETAKNRCQKVRKQRGTRGKQDILLLENKSTDNAAHVLILESERRTFLK